MCDLCSREPTDLSLLDLYPELTTPRRFAAAIIENEKDEIFNDGYDNGYNDGYNLGKIEAANHPE